MNQLAQEILKRLTTNTSKRQNRSTDLLKPAEAEFTHGWFICVPQCFNDSLDIRLTERVTNGRKTLTWTQGSEFSFSVGDTLYDTPHAYRTWSSALEVISCCVQVKHAMPVMPGTGVGDRSPGSVTFDLLRPDKRRDKLVRESQMTMTQDEFVRFLIAGPQDIC